MAIERYCPVVTKPPLAWPASDGSLTLRYQRSSPSAGSPVPYGPWMTSATARPVGRLLDRPPIREGLDRRRRLRPRVARRGTVAPPAGPRWAAGSPDRSGGSPKRSGNNVPGING
jgi:hypothetical protein